MEILKHGKKIPETNTAEIITCPYCSCVFKAHSTDFLCERRLDGNRVIVCPDCHANIFSINNSLRPVGFGDNIHLDNSYTGMNICNSCMHSGTLVCNTCPRRVETICTNSYD